MGPDLRFLGTPPKAVGNGLESVVTGVLAGGAPEPSWIAIDDGTDGWVALASGCSSAERARGVVAASADDALVKAQWLGVGGAMWLPPSSVGVAEAFVAATSAMTPTEGHDANIIDLMDGGAAVAILSIVDRSFWRAQFGERRLTALLAELASALGAPSAVLPWPALVVVGKKPDELIEAWRALLTKDDRVLPNVAAAPLVENVPGEGLLASAYRALLEAGPLAPVVDAGGLCLPVYEVPHGRRVGWWGRYKDESSARDGWSASPETVSQPRCRWRLDGKDGSGVIEEVLTSEEVGRIEDVVAVRIPGWASRDIRPGSPAGLLVTRLAEAADRRGLPLWIPNLDDDALRLALGLPGVLWVDGTAVPRS